jgi:phosphatidylserine/phosphatidylglycerophosphate/cardiolipin synthase-like enzyme
VPIHGLYQDRDADGVPERYLHMKSVSIQGVYGGNTAANVVLTGSPNWSARAARSDEVWVKIFDAAVLARRYASHIDRLRTINLVQGTGDLRVLMRRYAQERKLTMRQSGTSGQVFPDWLELD